MSSVTGSGEPAVSVVVPVHNEAENIPVLVDEIAAALGGREPFEAVFVNDGSTDDTQQVLAKLQASRPWLRQIKHAHGAGQSAAIRSGVRAARAPIVVTLDGDGQNDPADLPKLMALRLDPGNAGVALIQGHRVTRKDTGFRRFQSRIANGVRSGLLGDGTPDTGCGIKLMSRAAYLDLPKFDHMHRFLPALFLRGGARVISVPVNHRPRARGTSKYGMLDRLWVGIVDIFGVMWLRRRYKPGLTVREE